MAITATAPSALRLLLVEDSPTDALLVRHALAAAGDPVDLVEARTLEAALVHLDGGGIDAVILDLGLPDSSGTATFEQVAERAGNVPVVVVTGLDDDALATELVELGAQDYLPKGRAAGEALAHAVRLAIGRQRTVGRWQEERRRELEAKDRFLSHVSHELRAPLAVVHQFISLLRDGVAGPLTPEQADHLEVAAHNVDQLRMMINDLLTVTRLHGNRLVVDPRPTTVGDVLEQTRRSFRVLAHEHGVHIAVVCPPDVPQVMADPDRLFEVVVNLMDNALKHTPPGGRVALTAAVAEPGEVQVTVADDGPGIPPPDRELVFDPFFQVHRGEAPARKGLGLGLYVCRQLIERHGGHIWIDGLSGGGTEVRFTLPSVPAGEGRNEP